MFFYVQVFRFGMSSFVCVVCMSAFSLCACLVLMFGMYTFVLFAYLGVLCLASLGCSVWHVYVQMAQHEPAGIPTFFGLIFNNCLGKKLGEPWRDTLALIVWIWTSVWILGKSTRSSWLADHVFRLQVPSMNMRHVQRVFELSKDMCRFLVLLFVGIVSRGGSGHPGDDPSSSKQGQKIRLNSGTWPTSMGSRWSARELQTPILEQAQGG